jgi:hypothetical protein
MNLEECLKKTMREMPDVFTSNQFNSHAVKNGYPKTLLERKGLAHFISQHAFNEYKHSKTWTKNSASPQPITAKIQWMTEEEMIEHLKMKGYKIMKPISEWMEC